MRIPSLFVAVSILCLQSAPCSAAWFPATSETHGVRFKFPQKPTQSISKHDGVAIEEFRWADKLNSLSASISKRPEADRNTFEQRVQLGMKTMIAFDARAGYKPKLVPCSPIRWKGHAGWQFTFTMTEKTDFVTLNGSTDVRVVEVGDLSILMVSIRRSSAETGIPTITATSSESQAFFNSLELTKPVAPRESTAHHRLDGSWVLVETRNRKSADP